MQKGKIFGPQRKTGLLSQRRETQINRIKNARNW